MRRAAKVDANHGEVVSALRGCGCLVQSLAAVGKGVPDLLVYVPRSEKFFLLEVKDGQKPESRIRLTPAQQRFFEQGWPFHTVTHPMEALYVVGLRRG